MTSGRWGMAAGAAAWTIVAPLSRGLPWSYDDGGRAAAGYRGDAGDCVVRAIAIAVGRPYREVYGWFAGEMRANPHLTRGKVRSPRDGVPPVLTRAYLHEHGWSWTPTMGIGTGCRVHLAPGEVPPSGPVLCRLSKHVTAVIDGIVHDTYDPCRDGTRCVYGWWAPAPGGTGR